MCVDNSRRHDHSMKIPDGDAAPGIEGILDEGEREEQGIRFQSANGLARCEAAEEWHTQEKAHFVTQKQWTRGPREQGPARCLPLTACNPVRPRRSLSLLAGAGLSGSRAGKGRSISFFLSLVS